MNILPYIQLIRPRHWIKNSIVLLPVIFGLKYRQTDSWLIAAFTAVIFCIVSSFVYVLNDIVDSESDKRHPYKRNRPIPAGKVSRTAAGIEALLLLVLSALLIIFIDKLTLLVILTYLLLQIGYIFFFKFISIADVICLSLGFVLRAVAGAVVIRVFISPWLFICMFTIFLFMGFCKRFSELIVISDNEIAYGHRRTLIEYTPQLLTHLITTSSGIAIVAFLSYCLSESTIERFGTTYFVYTLPFLVYAVFRFAMLSMKGIYSDQVDIILKDRPFEIVTLVWVVSILFIIIYGPQIKEYLNTLY
ncbi:MAG: UbiA prenyltransferase family protein [Sedimentisphaerales bacterium]